MLDPGRGFQQNRTLTFENIGTLPVKIGWGASGIVDIPARIIQLIILEGLDRRDSQSIKIMKLRRPHIAASTGSFVGPDNFGFSFLESFESGSPSDLQISPSRCHQIIITACVYNVRIRAIFRFQWVWEGCRANQGSQRQRRGNESKKLHCAWLILTSNGSVIGNCVRAIKGNSIALYDQSRGCRSLFCEVSSTNYIHILINLLHQPFLTLNIKIQEIRYIKKLGEWRRHEACTEI